MIVDINRNRSDRVINVAARNRNALSARLKQRNRARTFAAGVSSRYKIYFPSVKARLNNAIPAVQFHIPFFLGISWVRNIISENIPVFKNNQRFAGEQKIPGFFDRCLFAERTYGKSFYN